jgi:hypothetical protein
MFCNIPGRASPGLSGGRESRIHDTPREEIQSSGYCALRQSHNRPTQKTFSSKIHSSKNYKHLLFCIDQADSLLDLSVGSSMPRSILGIVLILLLLSASGCVLPQPLSHPSLVLHTCSGKPRHCEIRISDSRRKARTHRYYRNITA